MLRKIPQSTGVWREEGDFAYAATVVSSSVITRLMALESLPAQNCSIHQLHGGMQAD